MYTEEGCDHQVKHDQLRPTDNPKTVCIHKTLLWGHKVPRRLAKRLTSVGEKTHTHLPSIKVSNTRAPDTHWPSAWKRTPRRRECSCLLRDRTMRRGCAESESMDTATCNPVLDSGNKPRTPFSSHIPDIFQYQRPTAALRSCATLREIRNTRMCDNNGRVQR